MNTWGGRCLSCGHSIVVTGCHCAPETPRLDVDVLAATVGKSGGLGSVASSLVQWVQS